MISSRVTCGSVLALLVVVVAYLYRRRVSELHLESVLSGLLRAEEAVQLSPNIKVAVGFGSCVDVIGPGLQILERIGAQPPDIPEHFDVIHNTTELEKVFTYFFRHGAAAERYTTNVSMFQSLVTAAKQVTETRVVVGGNAPVMLKSFKRHGVRVLLGAQMSSDLRNMIGVDIDVAGNEVTTDDIHLILEYEKGQQFGDYTAVRSNRFIIHNDANNPSLIALEKFSEALVEFGPHLVVVSGLQMLDNFPFPEGVRRARLDKLSTALSEIPQNTAIHFEMASFTEHDCLKDIIDTVVRYSDSLGMNEQELPNLLGLLNEDRITLLSDAYPRVATTLDQMRLLYSLLRRTTDGLEGRRKITRLHVHTLAFQAIITHVGSSWKNSRSAAAKASLAATRHTCGSTSVSIVKSRLLMDDSFATTAKVVEDARDSDSATARRIEFDSEDPVSCWTESLSNSSVAGGLGEQVEICVAPVLVCTKVVQTVGGGDNISSAGLVLQL